MSTNKTKMVVKDRRGRSTTKLVGNNWVTSHKIQGANLRIVTKIIPVTN